ncbi:MAG: CARDB domain-containing protein [Candidatus Thalassarchaeaceae archaeon]|nr:CARDB domain-containing protein [Candidatus Thalassarchaeaceae archaeon]
MRNHSVPTILTILLLSSLLSCSVSADTVIRSEEVDMLPAGHFDNPSQWSLVTHKAYSEVVADYTVAMVADNHLSFTHSRPTNYGEFTAWGSYSGTGDNLSLGAPDCLNPSSIPVCDADGDGDSDGGFAWSKGPTIEVENFDISEGGTNIIVNASLIVAFRIPESLQTDSVDILVESNGASHHLKTYSHTMNAVNYMQNNAKEFPLDEVKSWSWNELSQINAIVDYVSVGGTDDSEVQVDAIGIWVRYMQPWSTFEMAKATHSTVVDESPIFPIAVTTGTVNGLTISSCGLENTGANSGTWTTDPIEKPFEQEWGRFHTTVAGNASWKVSESTDGTFWSEFNSISPQDILPSGKYLKFQGTVIDGCIEEIRVDINDPTITINGSISGAINSMVGGAGFVKFAMNGEEIASFDITSGPFTFTIPVGHLIPESGGLIDIGVSTRFFWSSDGSPESIVVNVDEMVISGGYVVEWDLDPSCTSLSDQYFVEDGGGRLLDFLYTCGDDYTSNDALSVTVVSDSPHLLEGNFVNGQIRMQPQPNAYGAGAVQITVEDQTGNTWTDSIAFTISEDDDAPTMESLPLTVTVEVGQTAEIDFYYSDIDTNSQNILISFNHEWVSYYAGQLLVSPIASGTFNVQVVVSDGTSEINQTMTVIATELPDLWVQSVDIRNLITEGSGISTGDIYAIDIFVRNSGGSLAQPVTIRCNIDGRSVDTTTIAVVEAGTLESASCDWVVSEAAGMVDLEIEIDWTSDIEETNEINNHWSTSIEIFADDYNEVSETSSSDDDGFTVEIIWFIATLVFLLAIIFIQIGPNRIRKIE